MAAYQSEGWRCSSSWDVPLVRDAGALGARPLDYLQQKQILGAALAASDLANPPESVTDLYQSNAYEPHFVLGHGRGVRRWRVDTEHCPFALDARLAGRRKRATGSLFAADSPSAVFNVSPHRLWLGAPVLFPWAWLF
jgi:hypothetical protein